MFVRVRTMMNLLFFIVMMATGLSSSAADETTKRSPTNLRGVGDPDTTCSAAYQKNPTKETCLATKDFFQRPCNFCMDGSVAFCYNADEAKWARIFGDKCETGPETIPE
jgi:cytochrome c5